MATRKSPAKGKKGDKFITEAIRMELNQSHVDTDGKMRKRLRIMARRAVLEACDGNMVAFKEIMDRVEGKVPLPHTDAEGEPLSITFFLDRDPESEVIDVTPAPQMIRDET